jgi:hypothetical protein
MVFDYKNYGIGESYLPKVYFERIVIEKAPPPVVLNDSILAYIDEDTQLFETTTDKFGKTETKESTIVDSYKKPSNTSLDTVLKVDAKIIFNAPDVATFQNIVEDTDFNSSLGFAFFAAYYDPTQPKIDNIVEQIPGGSQNLKAYDIGIKNKINENANAISTPVTPLIVQITQGLYHEDNNSIDTSDVFKKYERKFPDGKTYFEIPYSFALNIASENPTFIYLLGIPQMKNVEIDFSYNFGGFEINDPSKFSEQADLLDKDFITGPATFETVIRNSKAQTSGHLFTISENQSLNTPPATPSSDQAKIDSDNIKRNQLFNSLKGSPWLGSVHRMYGRFMAGEQHNSDEIHPFVDVHPFPNRKVIDHRPLSQVKESLVDLSSLNELLDLNDIRYGGPYNTKHSFEKLPIFSDCFLSANKEGIINGFFGVDYIKLLKVHGLVPALLDKIAQMDKSNTPFANASFLAFLKDNLAKFLKVKIYRHGAGKKKLIYDSDRVDSKGVFPAITGEQTVDKNKTAPLGFLNPLELDMKSFNLSSVGIFEFYTFSDLDPNKNFDTDYSYEVDFTLTDPLFVLLNIILQMITIAIDGFGTLFGLKQLIALVTVQTKNKNILNESASPYIEGTYANLLPSDFTVEGGTKYVPPKTTLQIVNSINPSSVTPETGVLVFVKNLLDSNVIPMLLNSNKTNTIIDSAGFAIAVHNATSIIDDDRTSLEDIVFVENVLSSLRSDLENVIDGYSNVNHVKLASGNSSLNKAATPITANPNLRQISAKKHFPSVIQKNTSGFDYIEIFDGNKTLVDNSLKQIDMGVFLSMMRTVLENYYSPEIIAGNTLPIENGPTNLSVDKNGYSHLPLYVNGIVLPESLKSPVDNTWSHILHTLLLYKKESLSKMDKATIFSYDQSGVLTPFGKYILNQSFESGDDNSNDMHSLVKAERNQTLAGTFGLSIQDTVEVTKGSTIKDSLDIETKSNSTNVLTNYFLSYVNNFVEGTFDFSNLLLPSSFPEKRIEKTPIQLLSLILYAQGYDVNKLGNPAPQYDFQAFMNSLFHGPSAQLFASRFAEYFFTFLNFVQIDYLSDFGKLSNNGTKTEALLAENGTSLTAPKWTKLTKTAIKLIPEGSSLFCRLTNHKDSFLPDNGIRKELLFYPNFNKYFLITGRILPGEVPTKFDFGTKLVVKGFAG